MTGGIIYLDISRLIARAWRSTPTGIDRVELAYAEELERLAANRLRFVTANTFGTIRELPKTLAWSLIQTLKNVWQGGTLARRRLAPITLHLATILRKKSDQPGSKSFYRPVYLLVSHKHLERPKTIQRFCQATGAAFIPFIHDLIPIEYPEYVRPGDADKHRARMSTVDQLADAAVVATHATAEALHRHLPRFSRPVTVAPFGIEVSKGSGPIPPCPDPYFVFISTIEPRKNHLLLLHTWRALAAELGSHIPRLVLLGRRGWENEQIVDMLDRCDSIQTHIAEFQGRTDKEVQDLLRGARALLMPSFAEGFGLPLAEALALGVPAIASDIPAHREVGGTAPEYLDPTDGPAWRRAIKDYTNLSSPRRRAQLDRLATWQHGHWPDHINTVLALIDEVTGGGQATQQLPISPSVSLPNGVTKTPATLDSHTVKDAALQH